MDTIYNTLRWRIARQRALERDELRCTISRLLGGRCSAGPLHVHHIEPVSEGGQPYAVDNLATTCAGHHPQWEALRRQIVRRRQPEPPRCGHEHRSREARRICERRMARQRVAA